MVAMLKRLMFDSESTLLEKVYAEQYKSTSQTLNAQNLEEVLQAYMVHWMMSDDAEGIKMLLTNRTLLKTSFPHWGLLVNFVSGQIKALEFQRQRVKNGDRRKALSKRFTFDDAHAVIGGITQHFASFWASECATMYESLTKMDLQHTGRVPLAQFYGKGLDAEWRFGESETYLWELGALDETSTWRGKQVIIPNYILAASNCIVSTPHYMVCCRNECDDRLGEIEAAVGTCLTCRSKFCAHLGHQQESHRSSVHAAANPREITLCVSFCFRAATISSRRH